MNRVAVYFVASPLQYLAARQIAGRFETGARQVLVWYKRSLASVVQPAEWDACSYMPWPRWDPLPGLFGVPAVEADHPAGLAGPRAPPR